MSKIKVLPVYPKFPLTFWSYEKTMKYVGKSAAMPPTGLLTVMAMLPEERFEVQGVVDLNVEPLTDEHLKNTDIVFTSTMIVQEDSHNEIVDRAHRLGKKVVAGGPFPTTYPEKTGADYVVAGEAEVTLKPFLEDLVNGTTQKVWTEKNVAGRGLVQLTRGGKVNITNTPLPRWDLINLGDYYSAAIQFSRGCPFDCDFCDITKLFGREPRTKTPKQMVSELYALYEAGHRGMVFIVDDNFIGNRKNVKQLLPYITEWQQERGYPFTLFTEASMNLAWDNNTNILKGMNEAGFDFVFLGIESVDDEVLKKMNKQQNTKMSQLEAVIRIQQAGLEVSGGFIIGSDGEKPDVFDNLYAFIQEAGIPIPMPGLLTALRGTDLYKRLESEGRIREESGGNSTHQLRFNFVPEQDERFLIEGYKNLISQLFNPKNYYGRCRTLQRNRGPHHTQKRCNLEGLTAFGKSLRNQLFARGGWEYFKFLTGTALRRPHYFSGAVAHAIKFDHFDTITRATLEADAYIPHTRSLYDRFVTAAENIYARKRKGVQKKLELISRKAHVIIERAERQYEKLHTDFRKGAKNALEDLRVRLDEAVRRYESQAA